MTSLTPSEAAAVELACAEDYQRALEALEGIRAEGPLTADAECTYGDVAARLGRRADAEASLDRLRAMALPDWRLSLQRGYLAAWNANPKAAKQAFAESMASAPSDAYWVRARVAKMLLKLGDVAAAEKAVHPAIGNDPDADMASFRSC